MDERAHTMGKPEDLPASPSAGGVGSPGRSLTSTANQRGLECPRCGCRHFHVLYTRAAIGGRILRRRECRHCGRRLTTYEKAT
jgi:hypothetical protein